MAERRFVVVPQMTTKPEGLHGPQVTKDLSSQYRYMDLVFGPADARLPQKKEDLADRFDLSLFFVLRRCLLPAS